MYRIRIDNSRLTYMTSQYLLKYKQRLREEIKDFLNGEPASGFKQSVGRDGTKKSFTIKVCNNPQGFTYLFLKECVDPKKTLLDDLLIGDVNSQIAIIQRVLNYNQSHLERLSAEKAKKMGYNDGDVIDDFNAIIYEIFVMRFFEGNIKSTNVLPLDKDEFVKNLGIRICPYCGRSYIYRVEKKGKNGEVAVKPQLDHFLPKRIYPFLAMNFFNLIPCCTQCNLAPCKVDNDPLDSSKMKLAFMMHPYTFDDTSIRFLYHLSAPDTYKPESYDILVGYKDKDLKHGYNGFLAVDKLYAGHNVEVRNMFLRARALRAASNGFYKGFNIRGVSQGLFAQGVLGFKLDNIEESRQLLYKFRKDTFLQMVKSKSGPKTPYFVDWNGKEIIVTI